MSIVIKSIEEMNEQELRDELRCKLWQIKRLEEEYNRLENLIFEKNTLEYEFLVKKIRAIAELHYEKKYAKIINDYENTITRLKSEKLIEPNVYPKIELIDREELYQYLYSAGDILR